MCKKFMTQEWIIIINNIQITMKLLLPIILIIILLPVKIIKGQSLVMNWSLENTHAKWQARDSQGELVYNHKMWIMGGWFNSFEKSPRDVWSSIDGVTWKLV